MIMSNIAIPFFFFSIMIPSYRDIGKSQFKKKTLWFITCLLHIYKKEKKKSRIPLWCIPYCLFPGCIVTWAWSQAKCQYMVEWLMTGAPEQRYWQNRETANVGLDSSVGRALARQSRGRRFKSRSSQFVIVHPNLLQNYIHTMQTNLWFIVTLVEGYTYLWLSALKQSCVNEKNNRDTIENRDMWLADLLWMKQALYYHVFIMCSLLCCGPPFIAHIES